MTWRVEHADCIEAMRELDEASVDAVVCDPPYGLEFMGKEWDRLGTVSGGAGFGKPGIGDRPTAWTSYTGSPNPSCLNCGGTQRGREGQGVKRCRCDSPEFPNHRLSQQRAMQEWHHAWATEALRVLKPGGHLLAAGGTRTFHRLVCAIEDAGFEVRDCIAHMYGSGFPKSHNGEWGGTALKPAFEPWTLARKPLTGTVEQNWREHGTGALNIDGTRVGENGTGRWPSNCTLSHLPECGPAPVPDYEIETLRDEIGVSPPPRSETTRGCAPGCPVAELDRQSGELSSGSRKAGEYRRLGGDGRYGEWSEGPMPAIDGDTGGASRFFATFNQPKEEVVMPHICPSCGEPWGGGHICPPEADASDDEDDEPRFRYVTKASRAERNAGLEGLPKKPPAFGNDKGDGLGRGISNTRQDIPSANAHPTVKPIDLMRWLVRLVTPPGGTVLDPFTGSGTTGIACVLEDFDFIGIEREAEYAEIARARIEWWSQFPPGTDVDAALGAEARERAIRDTGQASLLDEAA